jgi:hypothetical protein
MPSLEETIALACNLAPDYYAKNMSPYALLQASGYREHRHEIDVAKIRKYVAQHYELVGRWIGYSEDKRVSSGWYFSADSSEGPFVIGYFPRDPKKTDQRFTDGVEACATFIKHELDSIAS